jgi:two-component system phosphate regulon sensor histidine kinase PhoR
VAVRPAFKPPINRAVPWLIFGAVLMPALATTVVGIVILALWSVPRDIVLGVLTLVFSAFALAGSILAVTMLWRQHRLARMQAEFVAHVSHELRTPLASIRMYVDTLRLGRVTSPRETEEFLGALARETARLSALVEQLLGFRAASLGTAGPREAAVPGDLLRETLEPFRHDPSVGVRLTITIEPGLPGVLVDREAFRGAIANLVRNAVAYGGDGEIAVTARLVEGRVSFEVRDRGPGIPQDEQRRIFKRFERGSATADRGIPGLGLGLALVKQFADAHGGQVTLDSAPGRGSTFAIGLPPAGEGDGTS